MQSLSLKKSWSRSKSTQITWTNGFLNSQIDHFLSKHNNLRFKKIVGTWVHGIKTDHALISAEIQIDKSVRPKKRKIEHTDDELDRVKVKRTCVKWDVNLLKEEGLRTKLVEELSVGANAIMELRRNELNENHDDNERLWQRT